MRITAAVARAAGQPFSIETIELDEPRADEVLVRLEAVGICHSDLIGRDGLTPLPAVLGHEGVGVVVRCGEAVGDVAPGQRVLLTFDSCGSCPSCAKGMPSYCRDFARHNYGGPRPDGSFMHRGGAEPIGGRFFGQSSFADHALARARNLVAVPTDIPAEVLAPFACAVQTGAGAVLNALACAPGASLAVIGCGSVGASAVMAARAAGCDRIVAVDPLPQRRDLALKLGATDAVSAQPDSLARVLRDRVPAGLDAVFDTSGVPAMVQAALGTLGPRGMLAIAGVPHDPQATLDVPLLPLLLRGHAVRGIMVGDGDPAVLIARLIAMHRAGDLPVEAIVTSYPFAAINTAIADQAQGRCVKPVLLFD